ncbi:MAG: sensor domain-containing diguanylate cyclase [Gammaproteobacteria bacterium]|nr:sensor domain-containing diguanylate cyclase [Gammaproteobacteria bacterium]
MKPDLYQENQLLRRQLKELLAHARKNEQKLQRLQSYELRLLSSTSVHELAQRVVQGYRSFGGAEIVTLAIVDPLYETQRIVRELGSNNDDISQLIFFSNEDVLNRLFGISVAPKLGAFKSRAHEALFPLGPRIPESVALLPLVRNNELLGCLSLGSARKEHFSATVRTDFLERLAAIVAICLENCINLERLKRIGLTDPLTGVNNRRFFDQRLLEEVGRAQRHAVPLACLLLDIDHFKKINDTHGHQVGDRVLIDAAGLMRTQLRGSDVLARYGGEEFTALLTHTDNSAALEIAERIRAVVAGHEFKIPEQASLRVTLSIGVAMLEAPNSDIQEESARLVACADQALYAAKHSGRNRVMCYTPEPALAI